MRTPISATDVGDLVCVESDRNEAARQWCEVLRSGKIVGLTSSDVPIEHLRRIYRVRLAKRESFDDLPLSAHDLLARLEAYRGETIELVVWECDACVFCVMLDGQRRQVVARLIGRDRRFVVMSA